ncbi:MAG TPA: FHA domain-containing protein [Vicinamibacterales bacterium]|nr:FHA domain-containing protein [Vicinamibacterales bacterium]
MSARLWHMGRDLQARVKGFFENPPGPDATPLELLQAALDELERKVQPAGRGRRVFPYDRIVVRIAQPGADPIAIDAIFRQLETRLRDRLEELKCETPESIRATVALVDPQGDDPQPLLAVDCFIDPLQRPEPAIGGRYPSLKVTVVKGQCDEPEYVFEEPVVAIGRTPEPTDAFGQVRFNHVAFLEQRDGVNETVGRAHARLQFDAASGHYHLFNEGSSNPTSVLRAGRTIRVAPRDPRGVRVQSGDQVQLGRAVLRLTIG